MKSIRYLKPFVFAKVSSSAGEVVARRARSCWPGCAGLHEHRVGGDQLRPGGLGRVAEASAARDRQLRERAELLGGLAQVLGRRASMSLNSGVALVGEARSACPSSGGARGGSRGTSRRPASRSRCARRSPRPAIAALRKKPVMLVAVARPAAQDRVAVVARLASCWFCSARIFEHPVGLAERRVGAVDHLAEVLAAAGEAGAELVEDQPEAVAVGRAVDVLDQVEVDRLAVVLERQQALARAGLAVRDLLELGRRRRARRRAAGSGCSRRTSRRSATAGG